MLNVFSAETFMLSVANKILMPNVIILNVIMLSVMAPRGIAKFDILNTN